MKQLTKEEILIGIVPFFEQLPDDAKNQYFEAMVDYRDQETAELQQSNERYESKNILLRAKLQQTASMYSEDKWIGVEDGLPDVNIPVVTFVDLPINDCNYQVIQMLKQDAVDGKFWQHPYTTHWQPLPTPPTT